MTFSKYSQIYLLYFFYVPGAKLVPGEMNMSCDSCPRESYSSMMETDSKPKYQGVWRGKNAQETWEHQRRICWPRDFWECFPQALMADKERKGTSRIRASWYSRQREQSGQSWEPSRTEMLMQAVFCSSLAFLWEKCPFSVRRIRRVKTVRNAG